MFSRAPDAVLLCPLVGQAQVAKENSEVEVLIRGPRQRVADLELAGEPAKASPSMRG